MLLFAAAFAFSAAPKAWAQAAWSAIPSPTTRNLWGITWGGGQFVAVGEGGAILTSPDGSNWTLQTSNTNAWLLAATYGWNRFVVVGDAGSILESSDGRRWTADTLLGSGASPAPPQRLNFVVSAMPPLFDRQFRAIGEAGTVVNGNTVASAWGESTTPASGWWRGLAYGEGYEVRVGQKGIFAGSYTSVLIEPTPLSPQPAVNLESVVFGADQFVTVGQAGSVLVSRDALHWTKVPSFTTDDLFGVTWFNHEYVAVGANGAVFRSGDGVVWSKSESANTHTLHAVAASPDAIVAVGDQGTIVRSVPEQVAPSFVLQPDAVTTNVGGAASFRIIASGTSPLRYQWLHDGQPLAGATDAVLMLSEVSAQQTGQYAVRVTNTLGAVTSAAVSLRVDPPSSTPIVDTSFRVAADAVTTTATALLPQPDGTTLVAGGIRGQLIRLRPEGSLDPAFTRGIAANDPFIGAQWLDNPDFFNPTVGTISRLVAQPDGRILVVGQFVSYNGVPATNIVRIDANGNVDPSFAFDPTIGPAATNMPVAVQPDGKILVGVNGRVVRLLPGGQRDASFTPDPTASGVNVIALAADGSILLGTGPYFHGSAGAGSVIALQSNGSLDAGFAKVACDPVQRLYVMPDGRIVVSTQYDRGPVFPETSTPPPRFPSSTFRLMPDGTNDAAFPKLDGFLDIPPAPDGSILFGQTLIAPDGSVASLNLGVGYTGTAPNVFDGKKRLLVAGTFTVYNGFSTSHIVRVNLVASENLAPPTLLGVTVDRSLVTRGDTITLHAAASGPGPLSYVWALPFNSVRLVTTTPTLTVATGVAAPAGVSDPGGTFQVYAQNSAGTSETRSIDVTIQPGPLVIQSQPTKVSLASGRDSVISIELDARSATYGRSQWTRDGAPVAVDHYGASGSIREADFTRLDFGKAAPTQAGTYAVTLTDALGQTVTSEPIVVTVDDASRFTNLSTRAVVGPGEQAAVVGFVIPAGQTREILIRGIGPSLAAFGVQGALADPRLDVFNAAGGVTARSNDWQTGITGTDTTALFAQVGAFPLVAGRHDAALLLWLGPGAYTARLGSLSNGSGVGLIELYEADNVSDRLLNISARIWVGANPAVAITGVAIRGPVSKRVLFRAAGPALTQFGVSGVLRNPKLEIYASDGTVVATNDDWEAQPDSAAVAAAAAAVGAFPFSSGARDAALVANLPPGNYTAVVSGAGGDTGIALVECYELP